MTSMYEYFLFLAIYETMKSNLRLDQYSAIHNTLLDSISGELDVYIYV